jgi:hypothetical protein
MSNEIISEQKKIMRRRLIKPARYKDVDTGVRQIVIVRDLDGTERNEERPIYERAFLEAVYEDEEKTEQIYVVFTNDERHEFANEDDAKRFKDTFK